MAGTIIVPVLCLSVLIFAGNTDGVPLPDGKHLLITTEPPDTSNPLDRMFGDASIQSGNSGPEIYAFNIYSVVQLRYARTLVVSKIINRAASSQEVNFEVVLPDNAFITGFAMETDNNTYRAFLTDKDTADAVYTKSVKKEKPGGLVSYRDSNLFDVNINVESFKTATFKLAYEELLQRRSDGYYKHVVTVNTVQIVPAMKVKVHIVDTREITTVLTPNFSYSNVGNKACGGTVANTTCVSGSEQVTKTVYSPSEVLLEFKPSIAEQKALAYGTGKGLSGQFEVLYDVKRDNPGGEVLVKDGHFVHLFTPPPGTEHIPKHIIFVLDISGSMGGTKISQLRDAMKSILPTLPQNDLFNVIEFESGIKAWGFEGLDDLLIEERRLGELDGILPAFRLTEQNIATTMKRIEAMDTAGGTNIFGALRPAVRTAQKQQSSHPNATVPVIFFLTDGDPTSGITDYSEIITELAKINRDPQIPIYSYAFGEDADFTNLQTLSLANSGFAKRIYEGLDATSQLKEAYDEISSVLLSNVTIKYLPNEVDLSSVTRLNYNTFFENQEIVVMGKTIDKDVAKITAEVTTTGKGMKNNKYQVESSAPEEPKFKMDASSISLDPNATGKAGTMERAFAYLTIKQLIEKTKLADQSEAGLKERAIEIAKKYSFATELTSLVVVKPDGQEQIANAEHIKNTDDDNLQTLSASSTTVLKLEEPVAPINVSSFPTLRKVAHGKWREYRFYDKKAFGLNDVSWLTKEDKIKGYKDLKTKNGTSTRYAILFDPETLDPADERDCVVYNLSGKCRHLSQCVTREIVNDRWKYINHYSCELNGYLAVCCLQ